MISRSINSVLIFILAIGLYQSACQGDKKRAVALSFNVPANVNLLQALRQQLPQFEKENGIEVKLIPFSGQEKLYAMMAAGQPPDVFYTNTVVRDQLAAEGRLVDLRTVAGQDPFVQQIRPEFIERGTSIDGGWYQFCDWTFTYGLYYNKTAFDKAKASYPDSAWTWQGLLQRARALTLDNNGDGKPEQFGIFIARHFVSALESMNGAHYPAHALFFELSLASQDALQSYLDLIYKEKVMPELDYVQAQGMQLSQLINSGRVAMIAEAVPNLDFITSLRVDWDVAPFPTMNNKPPRYFRSASGGLSISSTCTRPDKAWELIKWLVTASPYNTPNPVLKDDHFITGWEEKYPVLAKSHFGQVWRLSTLYDGGDNRDFVRYFSWSSSTILERLNPLMDQLFAGKIQIKDIVAATPLINAQVHSELDKLVNNSGRSPLFREKIKEILKQQ